MPASGNKFKVRTGCITCKIRKIKCDESKPACTRCTSTGRKCDGYIQLGAQDSRKQQSQEQGQSALILRNSDALCTNIVAPPSVLSADERRWLTYFSQHVGPALSDLADKDFWSRILPQISVSESAVRHALLAVGSSYIRFEPHSDMYSAANMVERDCSVKHYSSAIAGLRRSLLKPSQDVTVPLICCLLFICVECLYGNQPLMLNHLNNGLRILSSTRSNGTCVTAVRSVQQKLERIFYRLDTQSTFYGKPVALSSGDPILAYDLEMPSTFDDVIQAKMYLDTVNAMTLKFTRMANEGSLAEKYPTGFAIPLQKRLQEQAMAWRNALDRFDESSPKNDSHRDATARLRIEHYASFIYLSNCLELEETSYDAYNLQFAALVSFAHDVLPFSETKAAHRPSSVTPSADMSPVYPTSFSLEASLIPSLYLTAVKCRDPVIRREALSLLGRHQSREGLWDARLNWRQARRIVELEERSMLIFQGATEAFMEEAPSMRMQASNGAILTDFPHEKFRITDADILRDCEKEPQSPVQAKFYTRPDGVLEPEHSWEEELWF